MTSYNIKTGKYEKMLEEGKRLLKIETSPKEKSKALEMIKVASVKIKKKK